MTAGLNERFTCPRCGSHKFGTSGLNQHKSQWIGHCQGEALCGYVWHRDTADRFVFSVPTREDAHD